MSERLTDEQLRKWLSDQIGLDTAQRISVATELLALRAENEQLKRSVYVAERGWNTEQDRIEAMQSLRARVVKLEAALKECAAELESEIEYRYLRTKDHPSIKPDYDRDMVTVTQARAALKDKP